MIIFLIFYIVFLVAFAIYSALGIYHLWRFGYVGDLSKPAIFLYLLLSILVIVFSVVLILTRSWPATIG